MTNQQNDLASRIERGEATNDDVARALGWKKVPPDLGRDAPPWAKASMWSDGHLTYAGSALPSWLTSLDAAVALVPADCRYMLTNSWEWADSNVSSQDVPVAEVWRPRPTPTPKGRYKVFRGRAPKGGDPAAALTAAALRAQAAMEETHDAA